MSNKKVVIHPFFGCFFIPKEISHLLPNVSFAEELKPVIRENPILIKWIEDNPDCDLCVMSIPKDIEYTIEEYDGNEWIAEKHKTWRCFNSEFHDSNPSCIHNANKILT